MNAEEDFKTKKYISGINFVEKNKGFNLAFIINNLVSDVLILFYDLKQNLFQ